MVETKEILDVCMENGLLLDKDVLGIFKQELDIEIASLVIRKFKSIFSQSVLSKGVFIENKEKVNAFFSDFPEESKEQVERFKIKLGLSIELSKEVTMKREPSLQRGSVKVMSSYVTPGRKIETKDFFNYYKNRFAKMRSFLEANGEISGELVSINKIAGNKSNLCVIGMVSDKKVTKNKNILLEIEDLTGTMRVLISKDKKELYEQASEIVLDSVLGFKGVGNSEIIFVNNIFFPEISLSERKKSPYDESVLFISDLHFGSKKFLMEGFMRFINYLNGKVPNTPEVKSIKYLFIVGDLVTGVGNYPGQEQDLEISHLEEQFVQMAELLKKIRKDIQIIISPGNHDCVRLMEPQPMINEKYAWPLYDLPNVIFTENPAKINIGSRDSFTGFNVLTYHGFSFPYYANNVPSLLKGKAMNTPEKIIDFLLKYRHFAPSHGSAQFCPVGEDANLIDEIPDIIISGHTHKSGAMYHNNILVLSGSSWEEKTSYQEKFGNTPDHCKVLMFNLKTRALKVLDFE